MTDDGMWNTASGMAERVVEGDGRRSQCAVAS